MEHLMPGWIHTQPAWRVPFYQDDAANGQAPTKQCLHRTDLDIDAILRESAHPLAFERHVHLLTLIQNYAFFGLVEECSDLFGVPMKPEDFLAHDALDGRRWLSTANWPKIAQRIVLARATAVLGQETMPRVVLSLDQLPNTPISILALVGRSDPAKSDAQEILHRIRAICDDRRVFLRRLTDSLVKRRALLCFRDKDYQLMLTCGAMATTLENFANEIFPPLRHEPSTRFSVDQNAIDVEARLKRWCPNRLAGSFLQPCVAMYMQEMSSFDDRLHGPSIDSVIDSIDTDGSDDRSTRMPLLEALHSAQGSERVAPCTDSKCLRSDRASVDMSPSHRCENPLHCPNVGILQDDLKGAYEAGTFPLVEVQQTEGRITSNVVHARPEQQFIAISHVWSHGLGNSEENSLPTCQVLHILNRMHDILPDVSCLWIDTLCIPVSDSMRSVRKIAISQMREIYQNATYTMVLDKYLQQVEDDPYAMGIHVTCSEWAKRLWTLQEAVLPGPERLAICFKNKVVSWTLICNATQYERQRMFVWFGERLQSKGLSWLVPEDIAKLTVLERTLLQMILDAFSKGADGLPPLQIWNPLERLVRSQLSVLRELWNVKSPPTGDDLLRVSEMLACRSTTRATDEYICIATLLRLDLNKFKSLPSSMDIILEHVAIPENAVFLPGPRLDREGFRWAPSTCIGQEPVLVPKGGKNGRLTPNGLVVRKTSLVVRHPMTFKRKRYVLVDNGNPIAMFLHDSGVSTSHRARFASKPVFILSYDYNTDFQKRRTLRAAVVEWPMASTTRGPHSTHFLFDVLLVRTEHIEHISPDGQPAERVDVEAQGAQEWLID